jgi:transcriptional regulator with XRE-family HTH domain
MAFKTRLDTSVGANIEKHRKESILSQEQLSEVITISRSTLANIENGRHQCSLNTLYEIAKALKIDVATLLPSVEEVYGVSDNVATIEYLIKSNEINKTDALKLEKYLNDRK